LDSGAVCGKGMRQRREQSPCSRVLGPRCVAVSLRVGREAVEGELQAGCLLAAAEKWVAFAWRPSIVMWI